MEYNQYWNEIKGPEEGTQNTEEKVQDEEVVSFSYGVAPQEPAREESNDIFDFEEDALEDSEDVDDSKMYANSSLFDLIDELEEKEEEEKIEKLDSSRFVNFEFDDKEDRDDGEKDVHIFSDELEMVLDEEDEEDEPVSDSTPISFDEPEEQISIEETPVEESPVAEETPVEEPTAEPVVETVEESVEEVPVEETPAAVAEEAPVEVPHFECPVFEDKVEETDIDKLIQEAREKESTQKTLMDSELLPLLKDIISFMPAECPFIDYIASLSNDDRKEFVRVVEKARNAWLEDKADKMFTIADGELSICILSDVSDPMRDVQRLETVGAQMFSYEKESWSFVKLYFAEDSKLIRADVEKVSKESFNSWQWRVVQQTGFNLWKSRQK